MRISWNQPIQSDGRYLAISMGSRENGNSYLQSAVAGHSAGANRLLSAGSVSQNPGSADQGLHPSMRDTALLKQLNKPEDGRSKGRGGDPPPTVRAPVLDATWRNHGCS